MPSNKRQKELARRRAERQTARRAQERARRRKRRTLLGLSIGGVAAGVVLLLVLVSALRDDDKEAVSDPSASPSASAEPDAFKKFPVACEGKRPPEAKAQSFGKDAPKMTIDKTKKYDMTIKTSCGDIVVALDAKNAPNTTNSFVFLAGKNFYDGSICHRMNDVKTFAFLQCGDPTGTGAGDAPGYKLAEENLEGAKYTRGTLAMANTGAPKSTGAQFFLVASDSELPPNYTVAGHVTKGLDVLDKIIALGTDGAFEPSPGGGHPKQAVYLEDVTVKES